MNILNTFINAKTIQKLCKKGKAKTNAFLRNKIKEVEQEIKNAAKRGQTSIWLYDFMTKGIDDVALKEALGETSDWEIKQRITAISYILANKLEEKGYSANASICNRNNNSTLARLTIVWR